MTDSLLLNAGSYVCVAHVRDPSRPSKVRNSTSIKNEDSDQPRKRGGISRKLRSRPCDAPRRKVDEPHGDGAKPIVPELGLPKRLQTEVLLRIREVDENEVGGDAQDNQQGISDRDSSHWRRDYGGHGWTPSCTRLRWAPLASLHQSSQSRHHRMADLYED